MRIFSLFIIVFLSSCIAHNKYNTIDNGVLSKTKVIRTSWSTTYWGYVKTKWLNEYDREVILKSKSLGRFACFGGGPILIDKEKKYSNGVLIKKTKKDKVFEYYRNGKKKYMEKSTRVKSLNDSTRYFLTKMLSYDENGKVLRMKVDTTYILKPRF
jgi:hypothetical protein